LIRKVFINEDAIRAKIEKNKKSPKAKKKSGFQKRLEEMAKQKGIQAPKKK
jgi:YidC/Oxa1 family membrane protein insertase